MGLRSMAVRAMRRAGLVAGGQADMLGDDDAVAAESFAQRVAVVFPDPPENLYQLRQWLSPLAELDARHGVLIVCQDSRTARALRAETDLAVRVVARARTLEHLAHTSPLGLFLYVGQSPANAIGLRIGRVAHVFLSHGESDKLVTVSNLVKGFDQVFVAGDAAVDRHRRALMFFDTSRLVRIGRPQALALPAPAATPLTVLYAPTWEGTHPTQAYSSVRSHGEAILASALVTDAHLIVRPHPRTGRTDAAYGAALRALRDLAVRHPGRIEFDEGPRPEAAMARAHVMITDVSAMAVDWLATGRPLIVTVPAEPEASVVASRLLDEAPRLEAADAVAAVARATALVGDSATAATVEALRRHYLGDGDADAATRAFLDACTDLLARRDEAWEPLQGETITP